MQSRLVAGALALVASWSVTSGGAARDDLFSPADVFKATLEAPFQDLLARARQDAEYSVKGRMTYDAGDGETVTINDVTISLRGHTSVRESECEFPKLKLGLPADRPALFKDVETLKIGTHCGEKPDGELTPKYGRWQNEKAPHREAAVYRLLAAVGVSTLRARPARMTYAFTDRREPAALVRNAMILEDDAALSRRLEATGQIVEKDFSSAREVFTPRDFARIAFAQAMIGNFDWCLRVHPSDGYRCNQRHPLWNVLALRRPGATTPAIYDFDLSGLVTGRHPWFKSVFVAGFSASGSEPEVEVASQLQRTRALFTREVLDATRAEFAQNKAAAFASLATSKVSDDWRPRMESYLKSFFAAIEAPEAFYLPAIVAANTRLFTDFAGASPACNGEPAPVGTIVSAPLETKGNMIRVMVLDAHWRWAPPNRCEAIHSGPVWVAASSVSTDFPASQ